MEGSISPTELKMERNIVRCEMDCFETFFLFYPPYGDIYCVLAVVTCDRRVCLCLLALYYIATGLFISKCHMGVKEKKTFTAGKV